MARLRPTVCMDVAVRLTVTTPSSEPGNLALALSCLAPSSAAVVALAEKNTLKVGGA